MKIRSHISNLPLIRSTRRFVLHSLALTTLLVACHGINGDFHAAKEWREPELKRARSPAEFERQITPLIAALKPPKVIFIGVYGGNPQPWEKAAWFDPQLWPPYRTVDLKNDTELNRIAYHGSVMHVVALNIGKLFPSNLTLMIQGDSDVVSDMINSLYAPGDRLFLAGHSFGGRVVGEVARDLSQKSIPVEMVAYIESFWLSGLIPANVRQAFNFYVPVSFAVCPGLSAIRAENERTTQLLNIAVPDPTGPYGGFCAEHRNIDSDPRVWKTLVEYLTLQAAPTTR